MTSFASSVTGSKSLTTTPLQWHVSPRQFTPHVGQKLGIKFLLEHAAAGLFADPGVGKTSMVLAAFSMLKKRGMAEKMLVICPLKPAYLVWTAEAKKWRDFNHLRVEILHGPKKAEALAREADVYVINPEGLDWLLGATKTTNARGKVSVVCDLKAFQALGFDTLVLDELTLWKHHGSNRHKALKQVVGTFARRWGLTGTPVPNGLIDLFGQIYMLDMGRSFGPYITHFRQKYFIPSYSGFGFSIRKGAETEIYERIKPLVLRLAAEDYIDMPELVENVLRFDLPADIRRIYDELEDEMISKIGDNTIVAANAAAASGKCRQVANGGIYTEDIGGAKVFNKALKKAGGRDWLDLHDEKTDLLENLVEELNGSPLLVAYDFKHDLARLQRRFGKDVPFIGGGTSPARATELERSWNKGELPLLLGHPQCLHPSTLVLTELRGWVTIKDVGLSDRVFDGDDFVSHAGCASSGIQSTIEKFGIVCTPDHLFHVNGTWVEAKNVSDIESSFRKACYVYKGNDARIGPLLSLRNRNSNFQAERCARQSGGTYSLPEVLIGNAPYDDRHTPISYLAGNAYTDIEYKRSKLSMLWRAWNIGRHNMATVREFLAGHASGILGSFNVGTCAKWLGIFSEKLPMGNQYGATSEQAHNADGKLPREDYALGGVLPVSASEPGSNNAIPEPECNGGCRDGRLSKVNVSAGSQKSEVFDLVNCGPRHRFVVRNPSGDMFVVHNSIGHGLNLQHAGNHVAWYGLSWNLELHDQFIGRVRRQGSAHKRVFVHYLMARNTVDETIYWALRSKSKGQDALLLALKELKNRRSK